MSEYLKIGCIITEMMVQKQKMQEYKVHRVTKTIEIQKCIRHKYENARNTKDNIYMVQNIRQ